MTHGVYEANSCGRGFRGPVPQAANESISVCDLMLLNSVFRDVIYFAKKIISLKMSTAPPAAAVTPPIAAEAAVAAAPVASAVIAAPKDAAVPAVVQATALKREFP